MFAPSLYPVGETVGTGDFATQAERNYLFDTRDFDTEYEQTVIGAYVTGDIFSLPGGAAWHSGSASNTRKDDIKSIPGRGRS